MKTETIMTPKFTGRIAKIIAEIRTIACIDDVDAEAIEKILQDALKEYYAELDRYYAEECYIAISSARSIAYDEGHSDGYADGYDVGYDDCHAKNHSAVQWHSNTEAQKNST